MADASRLFLFAPGAGAPSSSAWMVAWRERLEPLGRVVPFDYPYQRTGKKSPDRPAVLVASHRAELARLRAEHSGPIVAIGKSMGGRIGCHVAVELAQAGVPESERAAALICLGYPLVSPAGAVRDEVLLELTTPVLFVQGSRDAMCPLDRLAAVRERMKAPTDLFVVDGGDHSLIVQKGLLERRGLTQADIDAGIFGAIEAFVNRWTLQAPGSGLQAPGSERR
jgi:predicted alpha/beta-hydrolase family hydrolase